MSWVKVLVLFVVVMLAAGPVTAAGKGEFIPKSRWEKLSKKYNYTENIKKAEAKPKKPLHINPRFSLGGVWLKYFLWGIVVVALGALLVWLLVHMLKNSTEKIENKSVLGSLVVEDIEEANLEGFLEQSLAEGSFKEAIRIRYLMLIRTLSRLQLVIWKKDKTNGAYVSEMYGKAGFDLFRRVTVSFERAWYGEKQIGESEYLSIVPVFDQLNKIVSSNE
ncbi:MAG TPA: hypothetical protein VHO72_04840 [Bacteroidales bacterium]|nr:hypothetical protein [Bacteroidales bacterium]